MEITRLYKIENERIKLLKEMELLQKQYEFYNQFCFDDNLGQAISFLISAIDNVDCVCQKIVCEIPEHIEEVKRRLPGHKNKQTFEKHFNRKVYTYIAILRKSDACNNFKFATVNEMKAFLNNICLAHTDYFGILNPQIFCKKFSCLSVFFHFLNRWRYATGRVTLDENLIKQAYDYVLQNMNGNICNIGTR